MSKERRTVTLEKDIDDYLAQDHVNASGLVNDLVKRHMNGDSSDGAIREFRIQQLKEEANEYASRAERKRSEAERLKQAASEEKREKQADIQEAVEQLSDAPRDPTNPAVKMQARRVGVEPEELVGRMGDKDETSGDFKSL